MLLALLFLLGDEHTVEGKIEVDGRERTYRLHVPPGCKKPAPLVIEMHGGGSDAKKAERHGGWSDLSDAEGFIVVYPEAVEGNWNDGRGEKTMKSHRENIDDVKFILALVDSIDGVDPKRVYATGASNGGMMSHRLGIEATDRIAAIAPIIGGIPEALDFNPKAPLAVMIIQGTKDPLVPYEGGAVGARGREGKVLPTEEAVKRWVDHNGGGEAVEEKIDDKDPDDGCTVTRITCGKVIFYRIDGGGHNRPGGRSYLPERVIGKTCGDFDSTEIVWAFFKARSRE